MSIPNVDQTNCELTQEWISLQEKIAELEQLAKQYQQKQALLEAQLKAKGCQPPVKLFQTQEQQIKTALEESEERLRLALEAANIGFWDWHILTEKVIWSENHTLLFGLVPDSFAGTYDAFLACVHPEDRQKVREKIAQIQAEKTHYTDEFRIVWPDQTIHWIAAKGKFFCDEQGQPIRMIGTCMDITDNKRVEQERDRLLHQERLARQEAEAANRIKDEFLAVLSHELRTPLNPILGWSKLLRSRQFNQPTIVQALETIERNAKLQTQLIEDLLDVSRILQGKLTLNMCPVSIVTVVEAAVETVRLVAEAKSIKIRTVLDHNLGQVMGDPNRLQQVVWNLLSNAVKFTPARGKIEIYLTEVHQQVQILVSDTGKGIAPNFLPYVFDYFRQADSTTTRKFGGLGLGLAIVRQVVELHRGSVKAFSPGEGMGATFIVNLPLIHKHQPMSYEEHQPLSTHHQSSTLVGKKVLVVDDEPDIRDLVSFILEDYGIEVKAVTSAQQALVALSESLPDILISDIGMPEVDGYMLMRQLRDKPPEQGGNIPAIALTAYAGEINQQQAIAAGFQLHISKPVDPDALIDAIASLVSQ